MQPTAVVALALKKNNPTGYISIMTIEKCERFASNAWLGVSSEEKNKNMSNQRVMKVKRNIRGKKGDTKSKVWAIQ